MKKLLLAVWLAVTLATSMLVVVSQAAVKTAASSFLISGPTTTTLDLTWTLGTASADSVNIVRISGSDTLFSFGDMSNTQTETTLVNLTPHTQYVLALRAVYGDSAWTVSNLDTLFTAWPNVENSARISASEGMYGARTWLSSNITWDSLYVASTAIDSTMVYWLQPYTAIQLKAIGTTPQVHFKVFGGRAEEMQTTRETTNTNTGLWEFDNDPDAEFEVVETGWSRVIPLNLPGDHFYIRAEGQGGNGNDVKFLVRLFRRK